jgi:hypothetical protein
MTLLAVFADSTTTAVRLDLVINPIALLALIAGLAAYVGTVRVRLVNRLAEMRREIDLSTTTADRKKALEDRRSRIRGELLFLLLPDGCLVAAGASLYVWTFAEWLAGNPFTDGWHAGVWGMAVAIGLFALFFAYHALRTVAEWVRKG